MCVLYCTHSVPTCTTSSLLVPAVVPTPAETKTPPPARDYPWASSVSSWPAHYWQSHAASAVLEALSSPRLSTGRYTICSAAGSGSSQYARRWQSRATRVAPNPSSSQWRPIARYDTCLAALSGSSRYSDRSYSRTSPGTL